VILRGSREDNHNPEGTDLSTYKVVTPGDLVLNKMKTWQGSLGIAEHQGIVSPAYIVCGVSDKAIGRFLHYLLRSRPYIEHYNRLSFGVRVNQWDMRYEHFRQTPVFIPCIDEQDTIVRFLAHFDRRINCLIRTKQRLIALLEEQKQAIIHQAVTRGLDPDVRLEPSGIDWLGDVPEHWEVPRIKQCANLISKGTTPSTEGREVLASGQVRFLKAENIAGGQIVDRPQYFVDNETHEVLRRSQLQKDDVLCVIAGATLGKIAVVHSEHLPANTNQAVAFIRPTTAVVPEYLATWLQSPRARELVWLNAVQSAQPNLSMGDLGNFLIPLPPEREQRSILQGLGVCLRPINTSLGVAAGQIDLFREYRTRLIADVVTGKLDVRGVDLSQFEGDEALDQIDVSDDEAPEDVESGEEGGAEGDEEAE